MNFENRYITGLKPYKLSTHRAWELEQEQDLIKLDWNEATIMPSPKVIERLKAAIMSGRLNWYPDVENCSLIYKIACYSNADVSEILYFPGSDAIHEYVIRVFIHPDDKVLLLSPSYDNFRATAESGGAIIHAFKLNEAFDLNLSAFQEEIDRLVPKLIYIVNPNNPTGSLIPIPDLKKLIANNQNCLFIVDEAYYEFSNETIADLIHDSDNLIITRTFSKAFALASFRIGYILANKSLIQTLQKVRNAKNIPLLAQIAAEAALDSVEYTRSYIKEVTLAKDYFYKQLKNYSQIKPYPSASNFIFIETESKELKSGLLRFMENYKIFIRDFSHINGYSKFVRITIGTRENMILVSKVLRNFFEIYNETNYSRP